jgi:DNA-binding MarR family transcriptional regulator
MSTEGRNLVSEAGVPFQTTLRVKDNCLCLHLQRAARAISRRFDAALKPVGLTNGQFSLLMSLNRPEMPGVPKATVGSVADLLGVDRTTLTAAVRVLHSRGLLSVEPEAEDRRVKVMRLTAAGRRSLALATPIWELENGALERELEDAGRLRGELQRMGQGG